MAAVSRRNTWNVTTLRSNRWYISFHDNNPECCISKANASYLSIHFMFFYVWYTYMTLFVKTGTEVIFLKEINISSKMKCEKKMKSAHIHRTPSRSIVTTEYSNLSKYCVTSRCATKYHIRYHLSWQASTDMNVAPRNLSAITSLWRGCRGWWTSLDLYTLAIVA